LGMPKQICANCHFFCRQYKNVNGAEHLFELSTEQRHQSKLGNFSWQRDSEALGCYKEIWNEGLRGTGHKSIADIVAKVNRIDKCYFFEYQTGMFMQAAEKLQQENLTKSKELEKYRLTLYALLLTILTLVAKLLSEKF
jgi:hypothetical protein